MYKCKLVLFTLLLGLPLTTPAQSTEPDSRAITLTISPLHLFMPFLELTGEYLLHPKFGLAAIGGAGQITVKETQSLTGGTQEYDFTVFEAGAQIRFYPFDRKRHSPILGGELLWIYLTTKREDVNVEGLGEGTAIGPFVGYKFTANN